MCFFVALISGGDDRIRTCEGLLTLNGLANRRLQPLGHISVPESAKTNSSREARIVKPRINANERESDPRLFASICGCTADFVDYFRGVRIGGLDESIISPLSITSRGDEAGASQVREVPRNLRLIRLKNLHAGADA